MTNRDHLIFMCGVAFACGGFIAMSAIYGVAKRKGLFNG